MTDYRAFIEAKVAQAAVRGFEVDPRELNPALKDVTRAMVRWALAGGRRALFAAFGLHKTCSQLEILRLIGTRHTGIRLNVMPLGVRDEFTSQAAQWFHGDHAVRLKFIRRASEVEDDRTIYLTNYESVREGILDVAALKPIAVSLDEAAILRGFGGTKTFREAMALFAGDDRRDKAARIQTEGVPFRIVATATPSPNEYIEILAYAAFLGVMDVGQAKTRFFKRNSEEADDLTLHPHKEHEFWLWVATWALFVQTPSDLGFSDEGYELPALDVRWHDPVEKLQPEYLDTVGNRIPYEPGAKLAYPVTPGSYSRARWQYDAHGFMRSSGNRLLQPEDLDGLPQEQIFKLFRAHSLTNLYSFEQHVAMAERLEEEGMLPSKFMLLPPASWHPDVWTDITRMRTLNGAQSAAGKEMHLCPLQFDIVDRLIAQFSMPGELVYDPFAGLGTVPLCAVKAKRRGHGVELNAAYFADAVWYLQAEERKASMPTLFALEDLGEAA